MTPVPLELHGSFTDQSILADSAAGLQKVGLAGLLAARGRRLYRSRVPGVATVGYRWGIRDTFTPTWWPQGIATGQHGGDPVVITSWFAQPRRGTRMGSRISVIDLREPARPRYHHVLLVEPKRRNGTVVFEPVHVHAGGIVWTGDRLLVAATHGGIREFRLGDILRTPAVGVLRRPSGLFGYQHLLPQAAAFGPPEGHQKKGMRYSFISLESGIDPASIPVPVATPETGATATTSVTPNTEGSPLVPELDEAVRLITGEYAQGDRGRLARMRLTDGRSTLTDVHVPAIPEMQGAVVHNGIWFVNASRGDKRGGDLWVGTPGSMVRHADVLPPGPEDNAVWVDQNHADRNHVAHARADHAQAAHAQAAHALADQAQAAHALADHALADQAQADHAQIWSVTEFPGKRWIYAIDLDRWQSTPGTS